MHEEQRTPNVGAGVQAAIAGLGDRPLGDEVYFTEGWSLTPGARHAYLYSAASDQVYVVGSGSEPTSHPPPARRPTARRIVEPSPFVAGHFARAPVGIILHGTRSGRSWSRREEFESTRRWAMSNPDRLAWHATGGEGVYAVHLAPYQWGWHAREPSRTYLGYEFAQPTVHHEVTDAQVDTFVDWLRAEIMTTWPHLNPSRPGVLVSHSELVAGQEDGKSDAFPTGNWRNDELRRRIAAAFAAGY